MGQGQPDVCRCEDASQGQQTVGRWAPGSAVCHGGNFCPALPLSRGAHTGVFSWGIRSAPGVSYEQDKILRLRAQAGERVCIPRNAHTGTTWKPSPRFQQFAGRLWVAGHFFRRVATSPQSCKRSPGLSSLLPFSLETVFQHHVFDPLGPMWTSPRMVDSEGRANACEENGSLTCMGSRALLLPLSLRKLKENHRRLHI